MKPYFLISVLFLLISLKSAGQKAVSLEQEIMSADTILVVRHKRTDGEIIIDKQTGKRQWPDKVVLNGRPNFTVITETKLLPFSYRQQLVEILMKPDQDKRVETCQTFIPFHAIVIIKDGKAGFIDISFACNSYMYSDQSASLELMDKEKCKSLKKVFTIVGISIE